MSTDSRNKKLHVLIIPSWYKTPETPVLGTFFEEQARALQLMGHTTGILYPEYIPPSDFRSLSSDKEYDFYVDKGIPTFNIKTFVGVPKMRRLSYARFSRAVDRVFEDYVTNFGMPDIIHAHSVFHAGICALHIARKHQLPMVITEHLTAFLMGYINTKVDIEISRKVFTRASGAIIVSHNFKKDLEQKLELPHNTFRVIHNLVNDLFLDQFTEKTWAPGDPFVFFTNSFLLPRKNIGLLIDSVKILAVKGLPVYLRIGGEGPEEDILREHVAKLELSDRVTFTGKLFRHEVKKELDDCHCFILGSQYETFGVVLIESLACGRPVVTTDSGGPRDFIKPEHGVIVEKHEPENVAAAMQHVMENYAGYDQHKLASYCRENFSQEKITSEIVSVYRSVLNKIVH
jgi:L-malate glycosyltransferase